MKILQIVPSISLVYGGPSQMVLGLSAALAQQGIEVTILTTNTNGDAGQPPLDVPLGVPIPQQGYHIIYFACSPFRRYKFSLSLLQWLGSHGPDYGLAHIHALFSPISTAAATVARYRNLPYILRPLGTLDPADLQKKRVLKQLYGNLLERPNLAGAAGVHFTTDQEAKISHRYGVKTHDLVIPLGVNLPDKLPPLGQTRKALGIPDNLPLVLFMSRIDPKKGLNFLLAAGENLINQGIKFHLVIAGSNPQDPVYEAQIKQQIADSSLASQTTITGFVQGEVKLGLLQDADLFVLPSYYENFGIAVAEAMAVGTPVVISEGVYIWPDVQQASAGWVTALEIEGLTHALEKAIADPSERQKRGENARKLVLNQYSWSAIAQQMIMNYQSLI
ncbi:hormogonium polysaccharide biosynthesis glycosyltransferase HpsP [Crocosphaera sp. UHCC 0190]|uniref:hormogonium polysaccharide biosynthesis glycosyltransferase HpsP n=1 Tax=Crocosphaera sp. UHCC 0190 TaxID=3110246 RepID=UPI002B21AF80|nr:hormogonium polysaccharide biosynthesis glycosyltransferase HpsP [Crocosphaera sp. UHCC 0190]MEA5510429.1 hormogonium polysaccharide biosynthesis glycosyltransferase HpsP [Crocosphaera sp. UHCC 0190]